MSAREKFLTVFPSIVTDLVNHAKENNMPTEAVDWFKHSLEYNTPGGKLNRGMSVVDTYQILKGSELSSLEYEKAAILGWCVELLQAFFLVADDMMDKSETRRGQLCWYKVDKIGDIAINDAFMLEASIYYLLKKHFRQEKCYIDLFELFQETTFQTEYGQLVDLITAPEDHVDLSKFSLKKHHLIVVYKTAFYSFYLPVALAFHLVGITNPIAFKSAKDILIPLGEYFQVQDDYLDCYGAAEVIGKIGTDIIDNKCSWLINMAIQKASPEQKKILDENYGKKPFGGQAETKVKQVYKELDLENEYKTYEDKVYAELTKRIAEVDEVKTGIKREVFTVFLNKIYRRGR